MRELFADDQHAGGERATGTGPHLGLGFLRPRFAPRKSFRGYTSTDLQILRFAPFSVRRPIWDDEDVGRIAISDGTREKKKKSRACGRTEAALTRVTPA